MNWNKTNPREGLRCPLQTRDLQVVLVQNSALRVLWSKRECFGVVLFLSGALPLLLVFPDESKCR